MKKLFTVIILTLLLASGLKAQKVSLSTNFVDWAALGTVNAEGGLSISQHFSLTCGVRYNPWSFTSDDREIKNQQTIISLGTRYWPWYVFSGWWVSGKVQYMDFTNTGIWRPALHEGKGAMGFGLGGGYTRMISKHLNLDVGIGLWGGVMREHHIWNSTSKIYERNGVSKGFIYPDDITVGIMYVF